MDESYRFSVIIPIYNSERTIRRCLDSILKQNRDDLQLLLINDGSNDKSGEICREYAENKTCVDYYEKKNGGVSSARNMGLDYAVGKYVLFVDSDDYVADEYFDRIDRALKDHSPNLLLFGNYNADAPEIPLNCRSFHYTSGRQSAETVANMMVRNQFNALWTKCFSNEIIQKNNIRFDESIEIAEDLHFIFTYMMQVVSVKAIPEALYYVDESNQGSLSRKARPNLGEQLRHSCLAMKEILERASLSESVKRNYAKSISFLYYRSVYSVAKELNKSIASPNVRRTQLRKTCEEYTEQAVPIIGLKNRLIAAPVRLRIVRLIDQMAQG